MNEIVKTKRFTARLPATPCTQEMRDTVLDAADELGMNIAELQRTALQFFLNRDANNIDISGQEKPQSKY